MTAKQKYISVNLGLMLVVLLSVVGVMASNSLVAYVLFAITAVASGAAMYIIDLIMDQE